MRKRIEAIFLIMALIFGLLPGAIVTKPVKAEETDQKVVELSLGDYQTAAIKEDGSLWMWGNNIYGQLGDGTTTNSLQPKQVSGMEDVKSVVTEINFTAAIKEDGSLWMWGDNSYSQLGGGTTKEYSSIPKQVSGMDNVKTVVLGWQYTAAIKEDGSLWMWGNNEHGQLGDGTTNEISQPKKILDNVKTVELQTYYGAAIKEDGSLWMWGENTYGQLGDGTTTDSLRPKQVLEDVKTVKLGDYYSSFTAAIKENGSLWMWGNNGHGQLGDGTKSNESLRPKQILEDVKTVALGNLHGGAIKEDGSLWMWGNNDYGQLGDGTTTESLRPKQVSGMEHVKMVKLEKDHTGAIKEDGSLWMWGNNNYGQLGYKTTDSYSSTPKQILSEAQSISFRDNSYGSWYCDAAAIKEDGSLWMWGDNSYGQLGDGTTTNVPTPKQIIRGGSSGGGTTTVDKKLDIQWGKDVFSFVNCVDDMGTQPGENYDIDDEELSSSDFSWADKMAMSKDLENWGGSCFGMSTVTAQNYLGNLDLTKLQVLPSPKNLYNLRKPKSNSKVKSLIGLYQSSCIASKYMAELEKYTKKGQNVIIKELYDKMCAIEETKTPVLVDYRWVKDEEKVKNAPKGSNDGMGAHAMLAYALENEGAPYTYGGKSYDYRIRTIDPNTLYKEDFSIEESNKKCIYINKECTDFCIPEGGERSDLSTYRLYKSEGEEDANGETILQLVTNNKEMIPPTNSRLSVTDEVSDVIYASLETKFSRTNENLDTKITGSVVTPGGLSGTDTESSGAVFVQSGEYTMELAGTDSSVSYRSKDSYRNVSGQGSGTVKFLQGKGIEYQPVSGNYEISYAGNSVIEKLGSHDITISGTGANKIKMSVEATGVKVSADHLKGLSVTTNTLSDGKEQETKISTDEKTVLIQNDTDGDIKILEDQDGDGTFEDPNQETPKPPTVPALKKISYVSKPSNAVYTGKYIKKTVKVKSGNTTLRYGTDYTVSYSANKYCGKAKMTIRGRNRYTGTWTRYFYIYPKRVSMQKVYPGKAKAKVCYKKASGKISGYQIRYSRYKSFKKSKYKYTKKYRYTVKRLSRRKKYYFKVRAYKTIGKKRYYGSWSKYKRVRIK